MKTMNRCSYNIFLSLLLSLFLWDLNIYVLDVLTDNMCNLWEDRVSFHPLSFICILWIDDIIYLHVRWFWHVIFNTNRLVTPGTKSLIQLELNNGIYNLKESEMFFKPSIQVCFKWRDKQCNII